MPRNSYRSHNGRSAVARRVLFSGTGDTNGIIPQGYILDYKGKLVRKAYFGGDKKEFRFNQFGGLRRIPSVRQKRKYSTMGSPRFRHSDFA